MRRHPSEKTFGVQLAGSKPVTMVHAAEVIAREFEAGSGGIDFVDVNCGCPIDLVVRTGSGSARTASSQYHVLKVDCATLVLDTPGKLKKILIGMDRALGEIPLTVKLRTGVKESKNTAHKLMPQLASETGVAAITVCLTRDGMWSCTDERYIVTWPDASAALHQTRRLGLHSGMRRRCPRARSRRRPYASRLCLYCRIIPMPTACTVSPIPIFGGGDVFSSQGYWESVERGGVDGAMVGRGALIKPWIFTEIKERREWDISARERLELVRKVRRHGLYAFPS